MTKKQSIREAADSILTDLHTLDRIVSLVLGVPFVVLFLVAVILRLAG